MHVCPGDADRLSPSLLSPSGTCSCCCQLCLNPPSANTKVAAELVAKYLLLFQSSSVQIGGL